MPSERRWHRQCCQSLCRSLLLASYIRQEGDCTEMRAGTGGVLGACEEYSPLDAVVANAGFPSCPSFGQDVWEEYGSRAADLELDHHFLLYCASLYEHLL